MSRNELNPDWLDGIDLTLLENTSSWFRLEPDLSDQLYGDQEHTPEDILKCDPENRNGTKHSKVALDFANLSLFHMDPKFYGVKSFFSMWVPGIRIDYIPDIKSEDGLESYDGLMFVRNKKMDKKKYRIALLNIVNHANIALRFLDYPTLPDFR